MQPLTPRPMSFRAFHLPSQRMFVVGWFDEYEIYEKPRPGYFSSPHPLRSYPIGECVLMQCTGLLNRQGIGVYEGDILRWDVMTTHDEREGPCHSSYFRVIYYNGGFCTMSVAETDPKEAELYYFSNDYSGVVDEEIAGNVYQHPELLQFTGEQPLACYIFI